MDCQKVQVLAQLGALGARLHEAELCAHLSQCAGCRALCEDGAQLARALAPQPAPLELSAFGKEVAALLDAEDRHPFGWLRARPTWVRRSVLIGLGAGSALLVVAFNQRADLRAHLGSEAAVSLLLLTCSALGLGWIALTPLHQSWRSDSLVPRSLRSTGLGLGLGLGALLPAAAAMSASQAWQRTDSMWHSVLPCFLYGGAIAVGLLSGWRVLDRSSIPNRALWASACLMAAIWANVALQLHCPLDHASHLLLGHASLAPVLLLLMLAVFALQRSRR
jgi:hypothetical protein